MVKNLPDRAGDVGLIPVSGRTPGGGSGTPLQYPCLGNPVDRGAWRATLHGVARVRHDLATKEQQSLQRMFSSPRRPCSSAITTHSSSHQPPASCLLSLWTHLLWTFHAKPHSMCLLCLAPFTQSILKVHLYCIYRYLTPFCGNFLAYGQTTFIYPLISQTPGLFPCLGLSAQCCCELCV